MKKSVCVLMSTYNGEKFIKEQIESIILQISVDINLIIRDDGSTDNTINIIESFMKDNKNIKLIRENNIGAKRSFFKLLTYSPESEYYAFSDQDDVWDLDKLISAINKIDTYEKEIPVMYYSETLQVDKELIPLKKNIISGKPFDLKQILIKNNAIGCTVVFNKKLYSLYKPIEADYIFVPYHDHWMYILCRLFRGEIVYDNKPHIKYRLHDNNTVGLTKNPIKKIYKSGLLDNKCIRSNRCLVLYSMYGNKIGIEEKEILKKIIKYKDGLKNRLELAFDKTIKPKTFVEKLIFFYIVLSKKF